MWLKYLTRIAFITLFFSCQNDEVSPSSGSADFREYLAVGNSLTAGYSDGGLYRAAQINSYPAILSRQLRLSSGLTFVQPLMPEGNGSGYIELLAYPDDGYPLINFLNEDPRAFDKVTGPFHNLGVPGIRVKDIDMKDYGAKSNNEFFYRMLPAGEESGTSYLDLIEHSDHSFFTCWMGNNDVLGYATEGGFYGENGTGEYERSGLTDVAEFESKYNTLIETLTQNDAKGILLTLPDIILIPYFNLVTNKDFPSLGNAQVLALQERYSDVNQKIEEYNQEVENDPELTETEKEALYRDLIVFKTTNNSFIIEDKDLPAEYNGKPLPQIRHLKEGEKITIPGILEITNFQKLAGINEPLNDRYVLTLREQELVESYRTQYNEIIRSASDRPGLALLDMDALINEYKDGKTVDGVFISTEIVEGGLFSLDGIHLTQRGYALVANKIVDKINEKYGASIPKVNISVYRAIDIP